MRRFGSRWLCLRSYPGLFLRWEIWLYLFDRTIFEIIFFLPSNLFFVTQKISPWDLYLCFTKNIATDLPKFLSAKEIMIEHKLPQILFIYSLRWSIFLLKISYNIISILTDLFSYTLKTVKRFYDNINHFYKYFDRIFNLNIFQLMY